MVTQFKTIDELPAFTEKGYHMMKIPPTEWNIIYGIFELSKNIEPTVDLDPNLNAKFYNIAKYTTIQQGIMSLLKAPHEKFSGQNLIEQNLYGVREYSKGATLYEHTDNIKTHHISSIIHLESDCDWPIEMQGHDGEWVSFNMNPGDILFYESAKCLHKRSTPMPGSFWRNMYVHYSLIDYSYVGEDV